MKQALDEKYAFTKYDSKSKRRIVEYLLNVDFSILDDELGISDEVNQIDGTPMPISDGMCSDGIYCWDATLPLYVCKNNVKIAKSFEEHISKFYADGHKIEETTLPYSTILKMSE